MTTPTLTSLDQVAGRDVTPPVAGHVGLSPRGNRGALLARVIADADEAAVPIYLETANPENLPYYRSFGFVETGRESLPRGASLWFMFRPYDPGRG